MNGYLLSVIGTVLISALFTAIIPQGKTASLINAIAKLACLLVIVSPVLNYISSYKKDKNIENNSIKSVINTDESFIEYYSEMKVSEAEEGLEKEILQTFDIVCQLHLDWIKTEDGVYIQSISVQTQGDDEQKSALYEYLTKNYCCEVLIE